MTKSGQWVNTVTAEVLADLQMVRGTRYPCGLGFLSMFQHALDYLASLRLSGTDCAVLFKLLAKLDYENWMAVSQETIGQALSMDKAKVSRAMGRLFKAKLLERERDPSDRRRWHYRLSTELGWKGDASQLGRSHAAPQPRKRDPAAVRGGGGRQGRTVVTLL